jgi:hypothetical protein
MPLQPQDSQGVAYVQPVADQSLGNALSGLSNTLFSGRSKPTVPTEGAQDRALDRSLARDLKRAGGDAGKEGIVVRNYISAGGTINAGTKENIERITGKSYPAVGRTGAELAALTAQEAQLAIVKTPAFQGLFASTYETNPNATDQERTQIAFNLHTQNEAAKGVWASAGNTFTPELQAATTTILNTNFNTWLGALKLKEKRNEQVTANDIADVRQKWDMQKLEIQGQTAFMNGGEKTAGIKGYMAIVDEMLDSLGERVTVGAISVEMASRRIEMTRVAFGLSDGMMSQAEQLHLEMMSDYRNQMMQPDVYGKQLEMLKSNLEANAKANGLTEVFDTSVEASLVRLFDTGMPNEETVKAIEKAHTVDPVKAFEATALNAQIFANYDPTTFSDPKKKDAALLVATNQASNLVNLGGYIGGDTAINIFSNKWALNVQEVYKANPEVAGSLSGQYKAGISQLIASSEEQRRGLAADSLVIVEDNGTLTLNSEYLSKQGEVRTERFTRILNKYYDGDITAFANGNEGQFRNKDGFQQEDVRVAMEMQQSIKRTINEQKSSTRAITHLTTIKGLLEYKDPSLSKDVKSTLDSTITQTTIPDVGTGPAELSSYVIIGKSGSGQPLLSEDGDGVTAIGRVSLMTKPEAYSNMKTVLEGPFRRASGLFGGPLTVNDGIAKEGTSREKNRKGSQHFEGTALDISTAGMSDDDKLRLVDSLQKAGFQGLGFGKTIIHADMGKRRSWHYFGEGNDSAVFAGGKTVGELINTHNGLTIPREGSYKTSEGNSGSAIEPDNDSDHGEGEPSGFAMGSTAPMSSTRPQGRPESDPALSGVIPEERTEESLPGDRGLIRVANSNNMSKELAALLKEFSLNPSEVFDFNSVEELDAAIAKGLVNIGDKVVVDGKVGVAN